MRASSVIFMAFFALLSFSLASGLPTKFMGDAIVGGSKDAAEKEGGEVSLYGDVAVRHDGEDHSGGGGGPKPKPKKKKKRCRCGKCGKGKARKCCRCKKKKGGN